MVKSDPRESFRDPYHFGEHTKEPLKINFWTPSNKKHVFWPVGHNLRDRGLKIYF